MAFLTAEEFQSIYLTSEMSLQETSISQINECLRDALVIIENLSSADLVEEIRNTVNPPETIKVFAFRSAQGKLAARALSAITSMRITTQGILQAVKDENDTEVNTFERFSDTELRRNAFYREALELIGSYIEPKVPDTIPVSTNSLQWW